jgi:endoglucanase
VTGTASGLQVYRDTDSNPTGRTRLASVSTTTRSYTDTTAVAGTQYWYWIKFTAGGASYNSGAASATRTGSLYPNYNTSPQSPNSSGMASNAATLATKFRLGWNIGNSLESTPGDETAWGNPTVSSALIQLVKNNGFTAVRIPVSDDQFANQSTAAISATRLARVKQVVQYCVDNGLYVVVDIHWDGGWLENNVTTAAQTAVNAKQRAYWQQIATTLRDFDEHVMFASANEPNADTTEEMNVLFSYHQTFVNAVRETGGRNSYRVLIVQGPNTDIELTNTLWTQMPSDTVSGRLMAEVHFYTPWNFAGLTQDESWGNQFFYWGAPNHSTTDTAHNQTWGEEAWVDYLFGLMKSKFVNQGIPVVIGEFAAMRRSTQLTGSALTLHLQSRAYYHKYVVQKALANGLLPFYWDNGGTGNFASGIFNRTNNTVADQQTVTALVQGATP